MLEAIVCIIFLPFITMKRKKKEHNLCSNNWSKELCMLYIMWIIMEV